MRSTDFQPKKALKNPHIQSILASSRPRRWLLQKNFKILQEQAEEHIINCEEGIRLQGFYNKQEKSEKGLVILFHGWEGSSQSTYILSTADKLYGKGFDIFRLNFRDHGESHHLNKEIFHSCRIAEVVDAVRVIAKMQPDIPKFLIGFSLGGNFALRVGLHLKPDEFDLRRIIAVNPVVSPKNCLLAIENSLWIYQYYFLKKWLNSLQKKQQCFPNLYDFSDCAKINSIRDLTKHLLVKERLFSTLDEYLDGYDISNERLSNLTFPATIITAKDDPIIPIQDFYDLALPKQVNLEIEEHGGHCGFVEGLTLDSWIERRIINHLQADIKT